MVIEDVFAKLWITRSPYIRKKGIMFKIDKTYSHPMGFHLTPIEMEGVGLIFLPKELEKQLGYDNLSNTVRHSDSFAQEIEYIILTGDKLKMLNELLRSGNTITRPLENKYSPAFLVLTESGLRNLLALSRKPEIHGFREWVSVEVLPEIKSTGIQMLEKFKVTGTYTNDIGFKVTPIEMQGVGFIFLPQELEEQLGYENFSNTIRQNESFAEGIEYLVLKDSNLMDLKELLSRRNTIASVSGSIYESLKYSSALIVLTESGFYTAIILSRKPNALVFRRWVTGDILPLIRRTGMFHLANREAASALAVPTAISAQIQEMVRQQQSLQQTIEQFIHQSLQQRREQEQFQQYVMRGFDRIDTVLSETLPHDMLEGWRKIKGLVEEMTQMYGLSDVERRKYLRELCQIHGVHLPEKALLESESLYHDAQELAVKIGVYSTTNKPHSRLVAALIRHLGLDQEQYCRKFPVSSGVSSTTVVKYSDNVIPHILKWLQEKGRPETIELACGERGKVRKFKVKYRPNARR